jgi:hypothetical protein
MIRPAIGWTTQNEAYVASGLATAGLADIKWQVEHGAQLFEVVALNGGVEIVTGAFVLRVDRQACKNVGVVVAAGGGVAGVDLTMTIMPHIEKMFYGCQGIRVHTARAGLVRKLEKMGFMSTEFVLERNL